MFVLLSDYTHGSFCSNFSIVYHLQKCIRYHTFCYYHRQLFGFSQTTIWRARLSLNQKKIYAILLYYYTYLQRVLSTNRFILQFQLRLKVRFHDRLINVVRSLYSEILFLRLKDTLCVVDLCGAYPLSCHKFASFREQSQNKLGNETSSQQMRARLLQFR